MKAVAVAMRAATRRAIADFMVVFVKSEDEVVDGPVFGSNRQPSNLFYVGIVGERLPAISYARRTDQRARWRGTLGADSTCLPIQPHSLIDGRALVLCCCRKQIQKPTRATIISVCWCFLLRDLHLRFQTFQ